MPPYCCICQTRSSGRFSPSETYEGEFVKCFKVTGRTGLICDSCKKCVYKWRNDNGLDFYQKVDSRKGEFKPKKVGRREDFQKRMKNVANSTGVRQDENKIGQTINGLPGEVIVNICRYLGKKDVLCFGCTCAQFYAASRHSLLWKELCKKDFKLPAAVTRKSFGTMWYDVYVLLSCTSRHNSSKSLLRELYTVNETLKDDYSKCRKALEEAVSSVSRLTNANKEEPVTPFEERIFRAILRKKQNHSRDGYVRAHNTHGRPVALLPVRWPEVPSNVASARTIRSRSIVQEQVLVETSTTQCQSPLEKTHSANVQRTSLIRRDKENYSKCAGHAGLKIFAKFTLEQATSLKKEMPFELWRTVKRVLHDVAGRDVVGSEKKLRLSLEEKYFQYECGSFVTRENGEEKTVTFVRVTSVCEVLMKYIQQLEETGEMDTYANIPSQCLKILMCGDKGSGQTKLLMTVLNAKIQHSVKRSKLLAIFEGAKDSPECIKMVFGPVIQQTEQMLASITEMQIMQPIPKTTVRTTGKSSLPRKKRLAGRRRRRIGKGVYGIKNNTHPKGVDSSSGCNNPQEFKFDDSNHASSSLCRCCQKHKECAEEETDDKNPQQQTANPIFTEGKLVSGGDWMYLSALLQYTGPNGVHFCPFCLIKLKDLAKGCPHAPITLQRYKQRDVRPQKKFPLRTLNSMHDQAEKFAESGLPRSKVSKFHNCEHLPVIQGQGPVLEHVSVMPLHLSLGIGLCLVNVANDLAKTMDRQIRNDSGLYTDAITEALQRRDSMLEERGKLQEELDKTTHNLTFIERSICSIQEAHPEYLAREGKKLSNHDQQAVDGRKKLRQLKNERQSTSTERKSVENSLKHLEQELTRLKEWVESPFERNFDCVMDSLNLKRQIYHSGALIGKDIDTVFTKGNNVQKIASVFGKQTFHLKGGDVKQYGGSELVQKAQTMLSKYAQVHHLMASSRPLCKHEVEFLKVRCVSLGNWFPCNFPAESLKRKFHILTYHVPEKANQEGSVGMESEHVSESIHPVVNKMKRRYANIHSLENQLPLICKSQWLLSDPTVPDYRKTHK